LSHLGLTTHSPRRDTVDGNTDRRSPLMLDVLLPLAADIVAITCVVWFYFRRHQRRDLMLSYAALNAGVLAVTTMLASGSVSAGLGLGLFGILSIIRLRSDSITQAEIAYYFTALA